MAHGAGALIQIHNITPGLIIERESCRVPDTGAERDAPLTILPLTR